MPIKDPEKYKEYQKEQMRRRRAEARKQTESTPISVSGEAPLLPEGDSAPPLRESESSAAVATLPKEDSNPKEDSKEDMKQIDGQVHLLSGSMGIFRSPEIVYSMSKRLLEKNGWCVWRYPLCNNETFVILHDKKTHGYPLNLPILTLNPDRPLEIELQLNIPGCFGKGNGDGD